MTPMKIARFMAGLLPLSGSAVHLLDPGAGIGSLSTAFLERARSSASAGKCSVAAYELDQGLCSELAQSLAAFHSAAARIISRDFIASGVELLGQHPEGIFTHAILNPPYKKIKTDSAHRRLLRQAGIETVNLYAGFVALALLLLKPAGHLVAIIPRSFCNGPYYKSFRKQILTSAAIRRIHVFDKRDSAFKEDKVLQENMIIHLEKHGRKGKIAISLSSDDDFGSITKHDWDWRQIVRPHDRESFIHIPAYGSKSETSLPKLATCSLSDLGFEVSTGPVIDFRVRKHLRRQAGSGTAPLIYPAHFANPDIVWPKPDFRKYNAIKLNDATRKWMFPTGCYVVLRRFSAKEEKRRIYANVFDPHTAAGAELVGFENHLNVFHHAKAGIDRTLAYGLAAYLNSTVVDEHFRIFSGHTQVNAADLRHMPYPDIKTLRKLGSWMQTCSSPDQKAIDRKVNSCAFPEYAVGSSPILLRRLQSAL